MGGDGCNSGGIWQMCGGREEGRQAGREGGTGRGWVARYMSRYVYGQREEWAGDGWVGKSEGNCVW